MTVTNSVIAHTGGTLAAINGLKKPLKDIKDIQPATKSLMEN
jgi:hypothetical protein